MANGNTDNPYVVFVYSSPRLPQSIDAAASVRYNAIALSERIQVPDESILNSVKEYDAMKKTLLVLSLSVALVVFFASVAWADPGGKPAAHGGIDGRTFGGLVSDLATSEPGAVAAHIGGK